MIRQAISELVSQISSLVPAEVLVTAQAEEVRPALDDGHQVIWILPPPDLTWLSSYLLEVTMSPIIISPEAEDLDEGLEDLDELLELLNPLAPTSAALDTIQLGQSRPYPAAQLTLTSTYQIGV